jgi:rhamnogalacturonyl hydrolase YesR
MSGERCPENSYQGFFQKTNQCWLDTVTMALIFGGETSDTIITQITKNNIALNFLENIFK